MSLALTAALLRFRNARLAARAPRSKLPVLGTIELLRALGPRAALVGVPASTVDAMQAAFRAARDLDAVVGLCCPFVPSDSRAPARFIDTVLEVAEQSLHELPVFLQAGPLRCSPSAQPTPDDIHRFVEAGFSAVALDVSRLPVDDAVELCIELSRPAHEVELSLELGFEPSPGWESARWAVEALRGAGFADYFLRVSGEELETAGALLGELRVPTSVEERGPGRSGGVARWVAAGARKVELGGQVGGLELKVLAPDLQRSAVERATRAGVPLSDLVALHAIEQRPVPSLEALVYFEVSEALVAARARGSALVAARALTRESR